LKKEAAAAAAKKALGDDDGDGDDDANKKPKGPPPKPVWLQAPDGTVKMWMSDDLPKPLCKDNMAFNTCYHPIYYPGFPSTPADPDGPLGGSNGDSQSV
jgi:hypothetical protein